MSGLRLHARCVCVVVVMGLCGLWATPSLADPARARAHFDLAKRYFEVNEYRKAIGEFKLAHIEEPDPAFLYNIAECHRHLGEAPDALVFYRRFLLLSPANAPARGSVEKRIVELQARIREAQGGAGPVGLLPPAAPSTSGASSSPSSSSSPWPAERPMQPAVLEPSPANVTVAAAPAPVSAPAFSPALVTSGDAVSAAPSDASANRPRPFYKRAWFFVVVGGALVAGAIGVWALSGGKDVAVPETPLGNQSAFR
jgi:tetratricopeptide (TPR) repeat protein